MGRVTTPLARRDFIRYTALGTASLLAGCATPGRTSRREEPFFFVHACDPQLFWGPLELWTETIAQVARLKPAFLVVGGDLINNNGKSENHDFSADTAMTEAYLRVASNLDPAIPLYNVAGNHDVCNVPTPETLAWYEKHFGKPWYSFRHNHVQFIVLESDVLKNPQGAPGVAEKQMSWLKETLQQADKPEIRHRIVFLHHPLCLKTIDEDDKYFNMPSELRAELLKLFHRHKVTAVFSGHYHRNAYIKDNELELVTTCSCGKAFGDNKEGFRIVKVYADRIEHEYLGLEDLPESVTL